MPPARGHGRRGEPQSSEQALSVVQYLEQGVDLGVFFCGAQAYVSLAGQVLADVAVGIARPGVPMRPDTIMPLYCTVKPVLPIAMGLLVDQGRLDFDAELGDVVNELRANAALATMTFRSLLSHTAGLVDPPAAAVFLASNDVRRRVLRKVAPRPNWDPRTMLGYSEWPAWNLLGIAVEHVTGEGADRVVRTSLQAIEANDTWLCMTDDEFTAAADRIGINFNCSGPQPVPMHYERKRPICTRPESAIGFSSARDLGRIYEWLLGPGSTSTALRTMVQPATPRLYDIMMTRECTWGLGFMTALGDHRFGTRVSANSFGHSGYHGMSFAFADPEHDLVVALVLDGLVEGGYNVKTLRRQLIDRLYEELGLC